jgi:hypothetical protein
MKEPSWEPEQRAAEQAEAEAAIVALKAEVTKELDWVRAEVAGGSCRASRR